VRRIILTIAVSLFTAAAPAVPAAAASAKGSHPHVKTPNAFALALEKIQDHRQLIEMETQHALRTVANHIHMSVGQLMAKWQRVAVCEVNGNWSMQGPYYSGIGFSNAVWVQYGGGRYARNAGLASPLQQVLVGMKITKTWIPDQYGCTPGGW
jgi:hypothetical protein